MEQVSPRGGGRRRWVREPDRPESLSPFALRIAPPDEQDVEQEVRRIVHTLKTCGPLGRAMLRAQLEAAFWGPGRFSRALDLASSRGLVTRIGGRTYAATRRNAA
jgi:hypothetical protein